MPGLDTTQLSSNWKRLQEKLRSEQKVDATSDGLKRKRPEERAKAAHGFKKVKTISPVSATGTRRHKMGLSGSKSSLSEQTNNGRLALLKDHDIAPEDMAAAYGSSVTPGTSQAVHTDDINAGLHPTCKAGKYIALDCEMVGTGPPPHTDNVLARASLVNFHGEQIYDSFVLPPPGIKVEDYRTFVSGIQPQHLNSNYARPFTEVQRDVAELLSGRVLVGHALRNDLQALILSHPKRSMRDTSRYAKFRVESKGKPPALRKLAKSELGMTIQSGEHSSIEDARAAMLLYRREKAGFEDEARRTYGQQAKLPLRSENGTTLNGSRGMASAMDKENEEQGKDEEDEADIDGEDAATRPVQSPAAGGAKKRKKKSRTRRR